MKTMFIMLLLCLVISDLSLAQELSLPSFMRDASASARSRFLEIASHTDLRPTKRRQMIDEIIAGESPEVQKAYKEFNDLLDEHKKQSGISLEDELEKARQDYITTNGHE